MSTVSASALASPPDGAVWKYCVACGVLFAGAPDQPRCRACGGTDNGRAAGVRPASVARVGELLWRAVQHRAAFDAYRAELEASIPDGREVSALLPHLVGVEVHEWVGVSARPFRDYVGWLACGLRIRLVTDADVIPNLLAGDER